MNKKWIFVAPNIFKLNEYKKGLACGKYHSCRIWEDMCPGRQHETGYYQYRSTVQKKQNHDS